MNVPGSVGDYHAAVNKQEDGRMAFDAEDFISCRPAKLRPMLTTLMSSQAFNQFIDERIDTLNSCGAPPKDMFEDAISQCREVAYLHPFYRSLDFVQDYPGQLVPEPMWILLKQETVSGSGISWAYANLHLAPDR